ncbi:C1 family peptidase [uncultured Propionibacterium sp.]|uniref:aminopeptidase C n=1 Tax=uncultured Propionibacterium sp. TaxID=218066 RepID=UPI002930D8FA|nr:C1 family peptidase [uncultured Propionibacterium sp.]
MSTPDPIIDQNTIASLTERFTADAAARVAQNAVATTDIDTLSLDRTVVASIDPSVSNRVDSWNAANQKKSGRCWLFSGLNLLRSGVIEDLGLEPDFEFSQAYLHFWDKLEKANWFLTSMIEMSDRDLDDRTVHQLLGDPIGDGGQWDMFVALVEKYGVVPKYAMPETFSSSNTGSMNAQLEKILRRGALIVREAAGRGRGEQARLEILGQIHRVLCIHLGTPPTSFIWQYRDKDQNFVRAGELTPVQFAAQVLGIDVGDYVCLVNDPRPTSGYNRMLTVDHLGNVVGGRPVRYLNVEIDVIKQIAARIIRDGSPVWFGCDTVPQSDRRMGIWDAHLHDYEGIYGIDMSSTKAERMLSGASAMTHAMVLTGVDMLDGAPRRWRVENSWGTENADKGFWTMNDSWFADYVYEVAVPRSALPPELAAVLGTEPAVLPLWDPMGALA